MRQPSSHNQSPMSVAARWVSIASTISLEMALPAAFGYWLDGQWNTKPWLVITGAILGFITGMMHLLEIAKKEGQKQQQDKKDGHQEGR